MANARVLVLCLLGLLAIGVATAALYPAADMPLAERPHRVFRDCPTCPEMVVIEPGSFNMGTEPRKRDLMMEALGLITFPRHLVTIDHAFAVEAHEVTFAEWDACVADGGCGGYRPADDGWGRGSQPVIHVTWDHAQDYVRWLSQKTGGAYRLLTDAEWEYAARAGTTTLYPWGRYADHNWANYGADTCCSPVASGRDQWLHTAPAGSFPPNGFGLYEMLGNVYEWVEDCYEPELKGAPSDGSAHKGGDCNRHVMRGGAWLNNPDRIRAAYRSFNPHDHEDNEVGFRVAKTL